MDIETTLTALLIIASIIILTISVALYQKSTNRICLSNKRLDGKTVIVTGGTAGMGLVIATNLADRGAKVIIACPFEEEGFNARNKIIAKTGNKNVLFKLLNLGSFESTRKFAADILKTEDRLDILINNAGIGIPINYLTKDNLSFVMQVNYYGTFLLTLLLLPLLMKTGKPYEPSRILTTTSVLHMIAKADIKNANKENYWNRIQLYGNSKIYLIYFVNELAKRLKGSNVVINNVDPGAVGTRIFDSYNTMFGTFMTSLCLTFFKTPWYGAQTALHAALDTRAGEVSGAYFKNCQIKSAVKRAYSEKITEEIWKHSVALVKLTDHEMEQCFKSL